MPDRLPPNYDALRVLRQHEGLRLNPYRCPAGKLTIGYGRNLDDAGISEEEAEAMLKADLSRARLKVTDAGFSRTNIGEARFEALCMMVFQLGSLRDWPRFVEYMDGVRSAPVWRTEETLPEVESFSRRHFSEKAADELLWKDGSTKQDRSDWWGQEGPAPNRCEQIASIIRDNKLPESWIA